MRLAPRIDRVRGMTTSTRAAQSRRLLRTALPWSLVFVLAVTGTGVAAAMKIKSADIVDNTVQSRDIRNLGVSTSDLAKRSITASKIASNAVQGSQLAAGAVTSSDIADGAIAGADIATGAVGTVQLQDGGIAAADLSTAAIDAVATAAVPNVEVKSSVAIPIPSASGLYLPFDTEVSDAFGMHEAGSEYITIPRAGVYLISASFLWTNGVTGDATRSIGVFDNQNSLYARQYSTASAAFGLTQSVSFTRRLAAGTMLRVRANNPGGAAYSLDTFTETPPTFSVTWLSA